MRILLDNNMPKVLRKLLRGHLAVHVFDLGWAEVQDHLLLREAEAAGYDVLITSDKNMFRQQNDAVRKIALIELSINSQKLVRNAHEAIVAAVERSRPGTYERIDLADHLRR